MTIGIWVIGITVQEIKHALYQGKERYLGEWWHLAITPMIIFYILASVLWIVGYALAASKVGEWILDVDDLLGSNSRTSLLTVSYHYTSRHLFLFLLLFFFHVSLPRDSNPFSSTHELNAPISELLGDWWRSTTISRFLC